MDEARPIEAKEAAMVAILRQLKNAAPSDIEGAAIMTNDGLTLAAALDPFVEPDRVSAMGASLLSLAERMIHELQRGSLDQIYARGTHGDVLLTSVGTEAVLVVVTQPNAKLGMLLFYMKRTAAALLPYVNYTA